MKKQSKGITLVALVITIIILLILAGISIASLTGSGLFGKSQEAVHNTEKAEIEEKVKLAVMEALIIENNYGKIESVEDLDNALKTHGLTATITGDAESGYTVTVEGLKYKVDANGKVEEITQEAKVYTITVGGDVGWVTADGNNPTTITEGETVTLYYAVNSSGYYFDSVNVEGADIDNVRWLGASELTFDIKNPTSDVSIDLICGFSDPTCCFVAGTQVLMTDGSTKNIEDVVVGDLVMSYNEETCEYETDEVIGLITKPNTTDIARVNLKDGTNIEMNAYHPVYTEEGWKSLTQHEGLPLLTENDKLLSSDGKFVEISSIDRWTEENPITTYNLSIKENHNFFVGNTPVLVHNASCAN